MWKYAKCRALHSQLLMTKLHLVNRFSKCIQLVASTYTLMSVRFVCFFSLYLYYLRFFLPYCPFLFSACVRIFFLALFLIFSFFCAWIFVFSFAYLIFFIFSNVFLTFFFFLCLFCFLFDSKANFKMVKNNSY